MPDYPTLKNAPIVEALVDIQVAFSDDFDMTTLEAVQERIRDQYPKREERSEFEFGFHAAPGGAPEMIPPSGGPIGFLFSTPDGKKILQARRNGFTFSKLKPYGEGDEFRREARELWQHFVAVTKPLRVTRLALRNINRIEIPLPFNDFREYLRTVPEVSPDLPQGLSQFFIRLAIPHPEMPITAIITSTVEPVQPEGRALPIIFDIDVFQAVDFDPEDAAIWDTLGVIRQYRNQIFFGSITEKAERLFR